jgi:hypothetical protein
MLLLIAFCHLYSTPERLTLQIINLTTQCWKSPLEQNISNYTDYAINLLRENDVQLSKNSELPHLTRITQSQRLKRMDRHIPR